MLWVTNPSTPDALRENELPVNEGKCFDADNKEEFMIFCLIYHWEFSRDDGDRIHYGIVHIRPTLCGYPKDSPSKIHFVERSSPKDSPRNIHRGRFAAIIIRYLSLGSRDTLTTVIGYERMWTILSFLQTLGDDFSNPATLLLRPTKLHHDFAMINDGQIL